VAFCTLVLSAFADVLPLVAIRTTFHPQTMTIAALVSLFCLNYVAAKTPREWMPPTQDLNLPEGITVGPTVGETCSWLDYYATFSRVDRLFRKGWKDSLTMKELDDIPWSYIPEVLRRRFSDLRTKHVRTGKTLVIMLWPKLVFVTAAAILLFMAELIAPFCLYQLLEYLRAPEEATLQPYLWLVVMFSGRMLHGLIQQTFAFTSRKIAIYVKLMLTGDVYQTALQSRELEGSFLKNPEEQDDDDDGKEGPEGSSTGMLENLISSDVDTIMNFRMFLWAVSSVPSAVIAVCGLYSIVGWPCFIGLLVMVSSTPVATFLMTYVTKYEEKLKTAQDARISLASEYLRSIKVIKYFGWEDSVVDKICKARDTEQKHLWTVDMLYIGTMEMAYLFPILSLLIVFGLYVGVEKLPLTAPVAYTTITLLATVRDNLAILASVSMNLPKALVSLKRFDRFFAAATPLDIYPHGPARIDNATFRRTETADFRLYNISIDFIQNGLTVIKGISGSGKTSLLLALLGETVKESGTVTRQRDAAFVSQSSWLQALTVRENIIFNSPNDDERYRKVVEACCLDVDFEELQNGDETNIGENGTALSGMRCGFFN
jgi:ABC-type multidrug transport system fused ATPase/permease subunit